MLSSHLTLSLLALFLFLLGNDLQAQEYKYEWGGGVHTTSYIGDIPTSSLLYKPSLGATITARYNANFRWATRGELSYVGLRGDSRDTKTVFPVDTPMIFYTHHLRLGLAEEFNFFPLSDKYRYLGTISWSPFVSVGTGVLVKIISAPFVFAPYTEIGGGVKYKLNSRWSITLSCTISQVYSDRLDVEGAKSQALYNPYGTNRNSWVSGDGFAKLQLGVTYSFGERNPIQCN